MAILPFAAGCSRSGDTDVAAVGQDTIACAVGGEKAFKPDCTVQRVEVGGQLSLVVHHPDGGFRRFEVMQDGSGIAVADGALSASTRLSDGKLEVRVGSDRYRFPAHVEGDGASQPEDSASVASHDAV
ncbi:hypothetical protein [Novosphingobium sp. 9]|uniref:hypothetical protein n=1 Tax=Novosphingobium sp. 9 TaxID=2025349 RepID=UPI0021B52A8D|nr:hypothetical protein [Novosphingobium sp. 9]